MFTKIKVVIYGFIGSILLGLLVKLKLASMKEEKLEGKILNQKLELDQLNSNIEVVEKEIEEAIQAKTITETVSSNSADTNRELLKQFAKDRVR